MQRRVLKNLLPTFRKERSLRLVLVVIRIPRSNLVTATTPAAIRVVLILMNCRFLPLLTAYHHHHHHQGRALCLDLLATVAQARQLQSG